MADHAVMSSPVPQVRVRIIAVVCELWAWLGPLMLVGLVIRHTAARRDPFLREVTAEVLNLQLLALVALLILVGVAVLGWELATWAVGVTVGVTLDVILLYGGVVGIIGAVKAWRGKTWRYPLNLSLVPGRVAGS